MGSGRITASCTCAVQPVSTSVKQSWCSLGMCPQLSPFVMKSQACVPESSPCGRSHLSPLELSICSLATEVFGRRYLLSNSYSITEVRETGRIFSLVSCDQSKLV